MKHQDAGGAVVALSDHPLLLMVNLLYKLEINLRYTNAVKKFAIKLISGPDFNPIGISEKQIYLLRFFHGLVAVFRFS